jgi:ABC-type branched-subunit amino acid transport system substrate-binding protein
VSCPGRRALLRSALLGAAAAALAPRRARAEETIVLGVVVPPDAGAAAPLRQGVALGLDDANALATLFGKRLRVETETADAAGAAAAGRALARAGALAVVAGGPLVEGLRDVAADGTVVLNVGADDERLRGERCERRLFHLAPSVTMYVDALAQWAVGRQRLARWAVVGDGSPRAREIEAAARRALGRFGASVVDANADLRLLALDPVAAAATARRARGEGVREPLAGIGADVPAALGPDEAIGLWAVGWHHELERFSARELNSRFRRHAGAPLTETAWAAWAAIKLVGEACVRAGVTDAAALVRFLQSAPPFDGHKGQPLTFRPWDHQLRQPLYVLAPRKREEISGRRGPFMVVADVGGSALDSLGTPAADSRCRFAP